MTTLILENKEQDYYENEVRNLVDGCMFDTGVIPTITEMLNNASEILYKLDFPSTGECILFAEKLLYELDMDDFYSISVYSDGSNMKVTEFLLDRQYNNTQHDIEVLDEVACTLSEDIESLMLLSSSTHERLETIESYLNNSGIVHYEQFMKELIEVLATTGLIDKELITSKMFNTIQ